MRASRAIVVATMIVVGILAGTGTAPAAPRPYQWKPPAPPATTAPTQPSAATVAPATETGPPAPTWATAATAAIHPGVQTLTGGDQCTANFVFTDATDVYIGQAAHCAGTGDSTNTDGCSSSSLPLGTPVEVAGASHPGVLAYSSWVTMQDRHETDPTVCAFNDLALVRLDPADRADVNPSVPHWGGPVDLAPGDGPTGSLVYSSGNSKLRFGLPLLMPKLGFSLGDQGDGWSHQVLTLTPGIPGDSGSAVLDAQGQALGVLSTLEILPLPGVNGVGDLRHELDYLHAQTSITAQLAVGTEPFNGAQLPVGP
ncbi:MAG: serine protease [Acidimicrobiales bacterium]